MGLTDLNTIRELARRCNIYPSASRGQNFLIDEKVLHSMAVKADVKSADNILEIGPGFGTLTDKLLKARQILAVELDKRFIAYLTVKFKNNKNLEILNQDILRISNSDISRKFGKNQQYRIIANIPYQITGKIVKKFISDTLPRPNEILILAQKEVGQRICATAPHMNLLAISVQLYGRPEIVLNVSKKSFWPEPKVDSCLLKIGRINANSTYPIHDINRFWQVVRIGFSSPRKQVHNNLANGLKTDSGQIKKALIKLKLGEKVRAQEISIDKWIEIIEKLDKN